MKTRWWDEPNVRAFAVILVLALVVDVALVALIEWVK